MPFLVSTFWHWAMVRQPDVQYARGMGFLCRLARSNVTLNLHIKTLAGPRNVALTLASAIR
ncbi:hypothetical protein BCAR13_380008 [Paraburkholderia caribensis]|nr:hypothetical protein BCAR13_380008 [Paraburkholderia caribensis]